MSTLATIVIGLTESDRGANYFPAMDGWRRDARQHSVTVVVELPPTDDPMRIVEGVFIATNAPVEVTEADPFAKAILDAGLARQAQAAAIDPEFRLPEDDVWIDHFRSLCVGDTVTVFIDGHQKTWACDRVGWMEVTPQ